MLKIVKWNEIYVRTAYICELLTNIFNIMKKNEKVLAMEIITEKQADPSPEKLPAAVVSTAKTLIFLITVAEIFTNDKVDAILDKLKDALKTFLVDAGV